MHVDLEPSRIAREETQVRSVGGDDSGDDGQAKTEPVGADGSVRSAALKGLEQLVDLVGPHAGSGVGDAERRSCRAGDDRDLDVPASDVVADGVVDEARHETVDEADVTENGGITDSGVELQSFWPPQQARVHLSGLPRVTAVALDLTYRAAPAALVRRAVDDRGRIDVLVNNVGPLGFASMASSQSTTNSSSGQGR